MFYSRVSEALFLFIRLLLAGFVAFGTCPSKTAVGGIIKKCGIIKRFNLSNWNLCIWYHSRQKTRFSSFSVVNQQTINNKKVCFLCFLSLFFVQWTSNRLNYRQIQVFSLFSVVNRTTNFPVFPVFCRNPVLLESVLFNKSSIFLDID